MSKAQKELEKNPDRAKAIKLEDIKIHEHTAHVHISV